MQLQDIHADLNDSIRRIARAAEDEGRIREQQEIRDRSVQEFSSKQDTDFEILMHELEILRENIITLQATYKQLARGFSDLAMQDRLDELKEAIK